MEAAPSLRNMGGLHGGFGERGNMPGTRWDGQPPGSVADVPRSSRLARPRGENSTP